VPGLTLDDLVANKTMSAPIAATLTRAAEKRASYLVIALPRLAGKSTVGKALLDIARRGGAPIRELGEDGTDVVALAAAARGGYLYVPEVSRYPVSEGYVWGAPVRAAFAEIAGGTSLSTALHADSADDAIAILRNNRVKPDDLARLDLIVHIKSLGDDWQHPTRRVVVGVHELASEGATRLLHHWDHLHDRFVEDAKPTRF
jgi:hypothetical protein